METAGNRRPEISSEISSEIYMKINTEIDIFASRPVIKGYYLVMGGGKIGTDFLEYARKYRFPFVLIIDNDENAPASRSSKVLKTENELVTLLEKKLQSSIQRRKPGLSLMRKG